MNLLLIVTGSISAYKAYDLSRSFIQSGHAVRVILSAGGLKFVKPETFSYLGVEEVYCPEDDFNIGKIKNKSSLVLHIELSKWCDRVIIAPCSANMIAKIAGGYASDLATSTLLALPESKNVSLFPAMNTFMWENKITKNNLMKLSELKNFLICEPESGLLACGDYGKGKLPEVEKISDIACYLTKNTTNKTYLLTTGATLAPLDPVRYLTNPSSGISGFYLARELLSRGHNVICIAGKFATKRLDHLSSFKGLTLERVVTAEQLKEKVFKYLKSSDVYISAAAIGDIEFYQNENKLKKDQISDSLQIKRSPDVLKEVIEANSNTLIVGFAAETNLSEEILNDKLTKKPVDLLIGTSVDSGLTGKSQKGFNQDFAHYKILKHGEKVYTGELTKIELAQKIVKYTEIQ